MTAWLPDLVYQDGRFVSGLTIVCDSEGRIARISQSPGGSPPRHAAFTAAPFSRALSTRTRIRFSAPSAAARNIAPPPDRDTFWTWREAMYHAATRLTPEDIYHVARMAFMEMLLSGITTVGEFHYLHHSPDGTPYEDRNLLADEVVRAAQEVGLRIALQRTAYVRAGWQKGPNPLQARFITPRVEDFVEDTDMLAQLTREPLSAGARLGLRRAAQRPRRPAALSLDVVGYARQHRLKVHMHVSEQPAEIEACESEYGARPFALLRQHQILDASFTAVHAIHISDAEIEFLRRIRAKVCACPTTERNLGDGIGPTERLTSRGVGICYGSDSNVQIDLLEDARQLEYHLRLKLLQRAILAPDAAIDSLAARLFENATRTGAESVGARGGQFRARPTRRFLHSRSERSIHRRRGRRVSLEQCCLLRRTNRHPRGLRGRKAGCRRRPASSQQEIVARFSDVQRKLWGSRP